MRERNHARRVHRNIFSHSVKKLKVVGPEHRSQSEVLFCEGEAVKHGLVSS